MAKNDSDLEEIKKALGTFAEAVVENLHLRHEETLEPFEDYELILREHVLRDSEQFKERFIRGYFILTRLMQKG